jgi:hypothetical protein
MMRKENVRRIVSGMFIALAASLVACGGNEAEAPPAADPTTVTAQAPTEAPPAETAAAAPATPPAEAAPAPPPPVEIPASYKSAESAYNDAVGKIVDSIKDEKITCDKAAAALTKAAKDKEISKTRDAYFAEREKLSDAQRTEADKAGSNDVEQKVSASPTAGKCKGKKKFDDAVSAVVAAVGPKAAAAKQ